jgi:hypothetical protein
VYSQFLHVLIFTRRKNAVAPVAHITQVTFSRGRGATLILYKNTSAANAHHGAGSLQKKSASRCNAMLACLLLYENQMQPVPIAGYAQMEKVM